LKRLQNLAELTRRAELLAAGRDPGKTVLRVCNTGCRARRSVQAIETLAAELKKEGLSSTVAIRKTGCHGFCEVGPIVVVEPAGIFYCRVKAADAAEIVTKTVRDGEIVERLLWREPETGKPVPLERDLPFYANQKKHISTSSGRLDPTDIDDAIAAGGYQALAKVLASMAPGQVVEAVVASGLRGRGGGGFLAGVKWRLCAAAPGELKYIIANGDEGDPGAFMDRSLMEGDPHSIIEGMIIGAYAIGARHGYLYVREEYPLAIEHLGLSIRQAEEYGLLGRDILGTGLDFDIRINKGAGAFVCGEETALMISIEGKSGTPRSRPPYPALEGLFGKPTVLNNVETFANIPRIIAQGAGLYAGIGTRGSKGTKIFSLVGKVRNTGLVEVEMGTTLREIIFGIGGGIRNGKRFKAVQTGGPSGGCLPASLFDMPIEYESMKAAGSIMGSGGMVVLDETACMVDVARYFLDFTTAESCGKCTACREGTKHLRDILTEICAGNGRKVDIDTLRELAGLMSSASLCALGGTAANPVLSTLRYFREEYDSHIHDKKCRAGVCKNLFFYAVDEKRCTGCTLCAVRCPLKAVTGEKKKPHRIDPALCTRCGICYTSCKQDAIVVL
jgi:NADH-quinone oxidoreductase subunit F